jgi:lipoprotein-anchoring transpeptidase ErfK/SrfK
MNKAERLRKFGCLRAIFCVVTLSVGYASAQTALPEAPPAPMVTNQAELVAAPQVEVVLSPAQLLAEAEAFLSTDRKDKARDLLLSALGGATNDALRADIEAKLGKLNVELVRRPWPIAEKTNCVVQEGDSIRVIAQKFGTTVDVIVESNELKRPDVIKPGDRLRVFSGKLAIQVSKSRHDLLVTSNGKFFKRYRVGTGKYDRTPVGTFVVSDRIKEPVWWRADGQTIPFGDKENILGTRWMALKATGTTEAVKGYGIHGTWANDSIGKDESAGCIRLKNEDVEELFGLIPVGTEVEIKE